MSPLQVWLPSSQPGVPGAEASGMASGAASDGSSGGRGKLQPLSSKQSSEMRMEVDMVQRASRKQRSGHASTMGRAGATTVGGLVSFGCIAAVFARRLPRLS